MSGSTPLDQLLYAPPASRMNLRSDQLQARELPPCLLVDDVLHDGVALGERGVEDFILEFG